jgi:hypothetical protein
MRKPSVRASDSRVRRSDLDYVDQEISELSSGVQQLQAQLALDQRLGRPMDHSLKLLNSAREALHELLRRRTTMFFAFVTGQPPDFGADPRDAR